MGLWYLHGAPLRLSSLAATCARISSRAFALGSGVFAQHLDYGTTPFPPPLTSFTCRGRPPGYYAHVGTGCRTYHLCGGNGQFTYICPRRTLFQQRSRTCDHWHLERCRGGRGSWKERIN